MSYKDLRFPKDALFLVTGGAGFIGSNLCEAILNMGYHVRCLDDLSTGKQENVDMFLGNPNYAFIRGDIKDFDTCMKACEGVDYVLNQAAWGSVPRSLEMPLFYCANNIQGMLNITSVPMLVVIVAAGLVGGLIGGFIGQKALKKHFIKAGLVSVN